MPQTQESGRAPDAGSSHAMPDIDRLAPPHLNSAVQNNAEAAVHLAPALKEDVARLMRDAGAVSNIAGSALLASIPAEETRIGGAALLLCGLIVADLNHGGNTVARAAARTFGSVDNALGTLALTACLSLGGGAFYRMAKEGRLSDASDPRWLIVAANFAPYMAAVSMDIPGVANTAKGIVEKAVGKDVVLAAPAETPGTRIFRRMDSVRLWQQVGFFLGDCCVFGFGARTGSAKTMAIGAGYAASRIPPLFTGGEQIDANGVPVMPPENPGLTRREFLLRQIPGAFRHMEGMMGADTQALAANLSAIFGRGNPLFEQERASGAHSGQNRA